MKVFVDRELCQEHGQCTLAAPEVFSLTEEGLVFDPNPASSLRDDVEAAIDSCPLQAISVSD